MDVFLGLLVILGMVVCWVIGRALLSAMGIVLFDTAVGLVMKPLLLGFFAVIIGIGIIGLIFKGIFMVLGWSISLIIALLPLIIIIALICFIVKVLKNR